MDFLNDLSLNERKLIVGIDFGTTFSGVAWASTSRADHLEVIETWPAKLGSREGMSSPKVPTELRYTSEGTEWGFQIPSTVERHQWWKIGLSEKKLVVGGKTPEELTTKYLTELYKHVMYTLKQKISATVLRNIPIEYCLTVPAIWLESAKEKTLQAAEEAGLKPKSNIHLVSEPEAAAIFALHSLDPHGLSIEDSFVLCDAGGGTVDLITYTIKALHPTLQVLETTSGTGDLCGSTFLNRRFAEYLIKKLGRETGWEDEVLADAMERFETVIKKQYYPLTDGADGYTVPVPGLANNTALGIRRSRHTIRPADMEAIFEPVILKIIKLVRGQITASNRQIRAVLLVGGFGQNNYLKERIRAALGGIEVLQPPNAWTAIVRGAVMMGLGRANSKLASVTVESRKARKSYGIELYPDYNSAIHDVSKKTWYDVYKRYKVCGMYWFVRKEDAVEENKPTAINFVSNKLVSDGKPKSVKIVVWYDSTSAKAPVHKEGSVHQLVTLEANLKHLLKSDLDKMIQKRPDGKKYYAIKGSVEATFLSASTKYVLLCQGKRYDTVTAEYV